MADLALSAPRWLDSGSDSSPLDQRIVKALNSRPQRERFKYTRADRVQALLDVSTDESALPALPAGAGYERLDSTSARAPVSIDLQDAPLAYMGLCCANHADVLRIDESPRQALEFDHQQSSPPLIVLVGEQVTVELTEISTPTENFRRLLWVEVAPGGHLIHNRRAFGTGQQWHFLHVNVGRGATYELHNHCQGAALHRQDIQVDCRAPGANVQLTGSAYVAAGCHIDQQVTLQHFAAHTSSQQTFHSIAADKGNVTFNGRIHIHADATGTQAHLTNRNLALGEQATINTKPELEIYTDDVACSHGATVGQLDDQQLFYCTSRGIDSHNARHLLSQAFLHRTTLGALAESSRAAYTALLT